MIFDSECVQCKHVKWEGSKQINGLSKAFQQAWAAEKYRNPPGEGSHASAE